MIFTSFEFVVFFAATAAIFFVSPVRLKWAFLLMASYFFYMYAEWYYGLLLLSSTVVSYFSGLYKSRFLLWLSILFNLSLLSFFKYNWVIGGELLLPIGLSFFVFKAISYNVDVYKGAIKPEKNFGVYALFMSFFPSLVAGPIDRAGNLLPQFKISPKFDFGKMSEGLKLMLWGAFKKLVIVDRLAVMVNYVYNDPTHFSGLSLILATLLFAIQIYFDFSAYSDIAIGAGKVMGINLMENFRTPYISKSISEFWKRWHISLSSWLRDYIYIPLGGNRVSKWRYYFNIFATFFVSGLWHGAAWTFVIWGCLHGFYSIFATMTSGVRARIVKLLKIDHVPFLHNVFKIFVTFSLVCFAWIFFRANSLADAFYIVKHLFVGLRDLSAISAFFGQTKVFLLITISAILVTLSVYTMKELGFSLKTKPVIFRYAAYLLLIFVTIVFSYNQGFKFIYSQF